MSSHHVPFTGDLRQQLMSFIDEHRQMLYATSRSGLLDRYDVTTETLLPPIDVVLQSHNHYDHLDLPTIEALPGKARIEVVAPLRLGGYFRERGYPNVRELLHQRLGGDRVARVGAERVAVHPQGHLSHRPSPPGCRPRRRRRDEDVDRRVAGQLLLVGADDAGQLRRVALHRSLPHQLQRQPPVERTVTFVRSIPRNSLGRGIPRH